MTEREWDRGPSIYPADQLLAWLERQAPDIGEIAIRLPVLVTLKPNRMYLKSATVGDQPGALAIKVNDTGMALPIVAKWNGLCGASTDSCMLLLRGVWRGGASKEFQVSGVERVIPPEERGGATFAELRSPLSP